VSWTTDLLDGLAQLLEDAGAGVFHSTGVPYTAAQVAIVFDQVPTGPDRLIVLTAYGGADDPTTSTSEVMFQARTRGTTDPRTVTLIDDGVFDALHNLPRTQLATGVTLAGCWRESFAYMGVDEQDRHQRSSNYRALAHRPTVHRI
jgi:hypothetical protein